MSIVTKKQKNEVAVVGNTPQEMIRLAISQGADLEKLAGILQLQKEFEANEARKVFNKTLCTVHKEMPKVSKTLKNPQTNSKYASLDVIIEKTKAIYTAYGFSISFYEGEPVPNHVRICADLCHEQGHKETYHYDVPLDGVGIKGNANMTAIHGKASSVSYGRRYLMCMIFNIPTGDDNDGNQKPVEFISEKQVNQLLDMIADKEINLSKFCEWLKIEDVSKMPASDYQKALGAIENKKKVTK